MDFIVPNKDAADSSLVRRASAGCSSAWGKLLDLQRLQLARMARRRLGRKLAAKETPSDLVQRTLLIAYQRRGAFRGSAAGDLGPWLRGILSRTVARLLRDFHGTSKRLLTRESHLADAVLAPDRAPSPADQLVARECYEQLGAALAKLPEAKRRVIRLRIEDDLPFAEIGRILGCDADAARMRFCRAVDLLREQLESTG